MQSVTNFLRSSFKLSPQQKENVLQFVAGGLGGVAGAIVTAPMDVAKTRLQASQGNASSAPFGLRTIFALRDIYKSEGVTGYFAGMGPTIYGVLPMRALYFSSYNATEKQLAARGLKKNGILANLISSVAAGIVVQTVMCPVWVVKTRMILAKPEPGKPAPGTFTVMKDIYRTEGVRGLFGGLFLSYLGISENAVQFVLFEQLKAAVEEKRKKEFEKQIVKGAQPRQVSASETFALASFSKLVASAVTYPHEVIRTRLRSGDPQYTGLFQTARLMYKKEGMTGLYAGMGTHLLRVVPNAAVMMLTHDLIVRYASKKLVHKENSAK